MNQAAAISAVYRALAHYRRRQANNPTDHSAREIAQMSMLAEYLHETPNAASRLDCHTDHAKPKSVNAWDTQNASNQMRQPDPLIAPANGRRQGPFPAPAPLPGTKTSQRQRRWTGPKP